MKKSLARQKKILMMIRGVYYVQAGIIIMITGYLAIIYLIQGVLPDVSTYFLLMIVMFLITVINSYFAIRGGLVFKGIGEQLSIKQESYENIEILNKQLRVQRHDFMNHIQVLYSLIELKEYDEVVDYLNRLYGDIGQLSANIKTNSVAVNALLQVKSNEAEALGIKYGVDIQSSLSEIDMPDWELCRILGNLIDNGFEASNQVDDKYLDILIKENVKYYQFIMKNSTKFVDEQLLHKIYEAGVTSKAEKNNHGMGLFIVSQLNKKYGNEIFMKYEQGEMVVELLLPKKVTIETQK